MMKYTWILGGLMAMAITACTSDELMQSPEQQPAEGEVVSVTAYAPGSGNTDSRVDFAPSSKLGVLFDLSWSNDDKFSVVSGTAYQTFDKVPNENNTFVGSLPAGTGYYYAVYPVLPENTSIEAENVPFDLSMQSGALDDTKLYMYAGRSNGVSFSFNHCTAILKATFTGLPDGAVITQVKVTTPDAYNVKGTINLTNGTLTGDDENNTITIGSDGQSNESVLSLAEETGGETTSPQREYYIYLPPMAETQEAKTFAIEVTAGGIIYTGSISRNGTIEAGNLYTKDIELSIPYVRFSSQENVTLSLKNKEGYYDEIFTDYETLEYFTVANENWNKLEANSNVTFGAENGDLLLRGICPKGTGTLWEGALNIALSNVENTPQPSSNENPAGFVNCTGDIRTLVNYKNYTNVSTTDVCFAYLFKDCSLLASSPKLTMMDLADFCYYGMFYGCTGLTQAPELPAETLAEGCYSEMFYGCTGLTESPLLHASILVEACYGSMFNGCTSLNRVTMLATNVDENCSSWSCLEYWLENVYPNGTFIKAKEMNDLIVNSSDGIPSGWTVTVDESNGLPEYSYENF